MTTDRIVHVNSLAKKELHELADYYRQQAGIAVAERFVENAERAFDQLLAMPSIGALLGLDELPYEDIRRWHIKGFERLIILYRITADGIEVVRVLNTSRDIAALLRDGGLNWQGRRCGQ